MHKHPLPLSLSPPFLSLSFFLPSPLSLQSPIEQVQVQTRHLVRQMARMQETLNALSERLESIDRHRGETVRLRGKVAHDGEEDVDKPDASQDGDGDRENKTFL